MSHKCAVRRIWENERSPTNKKKYLPLPTKYAQSWIQRIQLEPSFLAVIELLLDQSDDLAQKTMSKLDQLLREKEETKALVSARTKLAFETFFGDVSQYPTFVANQEKLYKMLYDQHALDEGAAHQLFQLSKILSPDLARTVMSFSGAKHAAWKAVDWLNLKFNSPQLMIPVVYQELKDISPARNEPEELPVAHLCQ